MGSVAIYDTNLYCIQYICCSSSYESYRWFIISAPQRFRIRHVAEVPDTRNMWREPHGTPMCKQLCEDAQVSKCLFCEKCSKDWQIEIRREWLHIWMQHTDWFRKGNFREIIGRRFVLFADLSCERNIVSLRDARKKSVCHSCVFGDQLGKIRNGLERKACTI